MRKNDQKLFLQKIVLASVFAAITTALTFYVKIPSHNGYIHLGDAVIFLAAALMPTPYAMVSAAIGGAFADLIGGYTIYIIPTLIIKALLVLPFSSKKSKILTKRNIIALFIAGAITVVGYYAAEVVLVAISSSGGISYLLSPAPWSAALYCIPSNIIQAVGSAIIFIPVAIALDKIAIKGKI